MCSIYPNKHLRRRRPTRFIGEVSSVGDTELVRVCTDLISSPTALEALEKAVVKYPENVAPKVRVELTQGHLDRFLSPLPG